jgi:hypothetical protein
VAAPKTRVFGKETFGYIFLHSTVGREDKSKDGCAAFLVIRHIALPFHCIPWTLAPVCRTGSFAENRIALRHYQDKTDLKYPKLV